MEKIISVRLAGRVMPIEEPAWVRLQSYFSERRMRFSTTASTIGQEEQLYELENGLAERLSDRITLEHPTLQLADVEQAIRVFDQHYGATHVSETSLKSTVTPDRLQLQQKVPARRFYRNSAHKWLGGVCSGIAHRLGLDPLLIRIGSALLLLTRTTVILAVVLYVLVWILAPETRLEKRPRRPLYRSRTDRKLGGVCGGLALAFGKESWIIRLVFLLPFLLTVGSQLSPYHQTGVFFGPLTALVILVYLLMWWLLPVATPEQEPLL